MKKLLKNSFVFPLAIVFAFGVSSNLLAQKKFEGYWEQESIRPEMGFGGKKTTSLEKEKTYYKPGKLKIENLTDGTVMIYRFDKELMWNIEKKNKTYQEITFAQMEAMKNSMSSAMQEEMKKMSPEQKQMMEKMMGKKFKSMFGGDEGGLQIRAKKTGKTKTLLSQKCEQVILSLNNSPMMEMWISDKYTMGTEFYEIYQKMGMMKGEYSEDIKNIRGIPLESKSSIDVGMGMGKIETSSKVTKIVPKSLSDSEFDLPGGLTKVESDDMPF